MSKDPINFENFIDNAKKLELIHKVILEISTKDVADIFRQQPYARYLERGFVHKITASNYQDLEQSLGVKFDDKNFNYSTQLTDFTKLQTLAHLQAYRDISNNPNIADHEFVLIIEDNQYLSPNWVEKANHILDSLTSPNYPDSNANQVINTIDFVGFGHSLLHNFNRYTKAELNNKGIIVDISINLEQQNFSLETCPAVTSADFNAYFIRKRAIRSLVHKLTQVSWPVYDLTRLFAFNLGSYTIANPVLAISMIDNAKGLNQPQILDHQDLEQVLNYKQLQTPKYDLLEHFPKYVFFENGNYQELATFYQNNPQTNDFVPYELVDFEKMSTADRLALYDQYTTDKIRQGSFPKASAFEQYEMLMSICRRTLLDETIADHDWVIFVNAKAQLNHAWYDRLNYLIEYCNLSTPDTEILILGQDDLSNITSIPKKLLDKIGLFSPDKWQAFLNYNVGEADFKQYYQEHVQEVPTDANVSLIWSLNYLGGIRTANFTFFAIKKKALLPHANQILERTPAKVLPIGLNFAQLFQFYELNMAYVQPFFSTIPANSLVAKSKHFVKQELKRTSCKTEHDYDYDQELANLRALNMLEYKGRSGFIQDLLFTDQDQVNTYMTVDYQNRVFRELYRQEQAAKLGISADKIELFNSPVSFAQAQANIDAQSQADSKAKSIANNSKTKTKSKVKIASANDKANDNTTASANASENSNLGLTSNKVPVLVPSIYERKASKLVITEIEQNLYDYELKMYVLLESGLAKNSSNYTYTNNPSSNIVSTSSFAYEFNPKITQPLVVPQLGQAYYQAITNLSQVQDSFVDVNNPPVRDQVTDLDSYWLEPERAKDLMGISTILNNHKVHTSSTNHSDCTTITNIATNLEQAKDSHYIDYLAKTKKFLINLNTQEQRYNHFYAQPNTAGFIHMPAVVGKNLSDQDKIRHLNPQDFKDFNTRFPTPGEMGCTLSHRHIYQRIIADPTIDDNELVLIAEDDIILHEDWYEQVNRIIHGLQDKPNIEYLILSQIYLTDFQRQPEDLFINATYVYSEQDQYHEIGNFPHHIYQRLGNNSKPDLPVSVGNQVAPYTGYTTVYYYRPSASSFYLVRKSALLGNIEKLMKPAYWFADGYQHLPYGSWCDTIGFSNPILGVQSKDLDSIIEGERYVAEMNQKLENRTIDLTEPNNYYSDTIIYVLQKNLSLEECQQRFPQATIIPRSNYEQLSDAAKTQAFDHARYQQIYGRKLSDAEIANYLTHYQALKDLYFSNQTNFTCAVVFEDDVQLADNWTYRINCLISYINTRMTLNTNIAILANAQFNQVSDLTNQHSLEQIRQTGFYITEEDKLRVNKDLTLYTCNTINFTQNPAYFLLKFAINHSLFEGVPCFDIGDLKSIFKYVKDSTLYMDPCLAISPSCKK